MFNAARIVGSVLRDVMRDDAETVRASGADPGTSFLVAGQIAGRPPRLFQIYEAGNFIEATPETPFLQIGETKYGKPILDRVVRHDMALADAAKAALISFDSTMRSNISGQVALCDEAVGGLDRPARSTPSSTLPPASGVWK